MRKRIARLLLSLAVAGAALAQDPDFARGFAPGMPYHTDGLDHTSLFNGTTTINIPLGQRYVVGQNLSYSLMASYATNQWDNELHEVEDSSGVVRTYTYQVPTRHSNAGFGWIVSLGEIISSTDDGVTTYTYLASDGGLSPFFDKLHAGDPNEPVNAAVKYTRDGSYRRLIVFSGGYELHLPNGQKHFFNSNGKLTQIQDQFGNSVTMSYGTQVTGDPYAGSTVWTITDNSGTGRWHKVYFRPDWSYETLPWNSFPRTREIVDKVSMAGFNGGRAEYQFNYFAVPGPGGTLNGYETSRRCTIRHDPNTSQYVITTLLTGITMPAGVAYGMKYDRGNQSTCSYPDQGGASGNIVRLLLPSGSNIDAVDATGGHIDWTYQNYSFPSTPRAGPNNSAGVKTRKAKDGSTTIRETNYEIGKEPRVVGTMTSYELWRRVVSKDGGGVALSSARYWFTGCRRNQTCGNEAEYGLPFTRLYESGGGFLSVELEKPNSDNTFTTRRKIFARYEADVKLTNYTAGSYNQRRVYQRTEYEDGKFTDVTMSDFDGVGHYRKAVTGGNFLSASTRTSYTDWNDTLGKYELDTNGNLPPGYNMPASSARWLWTRYDKQWNEQDGVTSAEETCFDTLGFLTSRRTFTSFGESPARSTTDLLAVFTRDTRGNLTKEQFFGGENGSGAPTSHACGQALTGESYRIDHVWQNGMRTKAYYVDANGAAMSTYISDSDFDANTALPVTVRHLGSTALGGSDAIASTWTYDLLGRVSVITGPRVRSEFQYQSNPSTFMTVREYDASTNALLRTTSDIYDAIGRRVKQTRSMPGGVTSTTETKYDALGRTTELYPWGVNVPTTYKYDEFGRVTSIKGPGETDATAVQIAYTGVSTAQRTVKVRTGGDQNTVVLSDAVTTQEFDAAGRLISLTEPAQSVGGSRPVTQYQYDVIGRLKKVCANVSWSICGQERTFTYDNRGFLTSETHPESGTTTYAEYDARGHLRRRYVGSPTSGFHIGFVFDRAERLTQMHEANSLGNETRKLKYLTYGTNNVSGSEMRNGQLTEAIRFNWVTVGPYNYNVQIVENYGYDAHGNISSRTTSDWICVDTGGNCLGLKAGTKNREFQQGFTYAPLGGTQTLDYPRCTLGCAGTIPNRTITNGYDNGFLTSVTWTGAVVDNGISYHPNGMVKEIRHDNWVYDKLNLDPADPSRPLSLVTEGALDPSTCVSPSFTTQPQSKTVTSGSSFTLTAQATGESGQAITYQWYRGTAPDRSNAIGSPITTTGVASMPSQTITSVTNYWVEASNSCSTAPGGSVAVSFTATVTPCTPSTVSGPSDRTITRGQSTTLTASAGGSTPLSYQWYTMIGTGTQRTAIQGATSNSISVSPTTTTRYRIYVTNACNTSGAWAEVRVTVVDPPTIPTNIRATYEPANGRNRIEWNASSSAVGLNGYTIDRSDGASFNAAANATSYFDTYALVANRTYVYRVRARDTNFISSDPSAAELTTVYTFTDDPIVAGTTVIKGIHMSQLRQAVDSVRAAAGLQPAWSSYTALTGVVMGAQFNEVLTKLNEARVILQVPEVVLTDTVLPLRVINGRTMTELRNGTK